MQSDRAVNADWPRLPKGEVHAALRAIYQVVVDEDAWRKNADEYHLGFYKQSERHGVRGTSLRGCEYEQATLPHNVCRGAVDTLQSKIAKQRPLPQVSSHRATWTNQKRARKMTQYLEGEFYRQRIYEKHAPMIVRDALIFGRGHLLVGVVGKRIRCDRLHPWEVLDDAWDARYGSPRNRWYRRGWDRGKALEQYARTDSGGYTASVRQAIEDASRFAETSDATMSTVDQIDIIDVYHLCDDPDAHDERLEADDEGAEDNAEDENDEPDDAGNGETRGRGGSPKKHKCTGRHVAFTTAGVVLDEPWEYDYFPDVQLNYNEPVVGSKGTGLVEQLEGYQYQINEAADVSAEQFRMSGVHVTVPDNAKISYQDIRNGIHIMGHQAGGEPKVWQMDLVNEHMLGRPRMLREDALNDAGLSEMSVQSEKPGGITAAVAIQAVADIETERFFMFGRAFEAWNTELGRRFIDGAKLIARTQGEHTVSVPMKGKNSMLPLRWADVVVDGVELSTLATSALPQQKAARLQALEDMWATQRIDRLQYMRLLDDPDMQAEFDLETAAQFVVDEMLERMRDADEEEGEEAYMPPTPYQPIWQKTPDGQLEPGWAPRRAQQYYNRMLLDGAPEYNLDLIQRFLAQCDKMVADERARTAPPAPIGPANINGMPTVPGPAMPPTGPAQPMPIPAPPMAA